MGTAEPTDPEVKVWVNPNGNDPVIIPTPFYVSAGATTYAVTVENNAFVLTPQ
jgi:hypothetical protein